MRGVPVGPLLLVAAGLVLVWSAVHGAHITTSIRDLLTPQDR